MNKTSIIIPTYNAQKLLGECLQSIKMHTTEDYEVIVVDNGSTDGTLELCRQEGIIFVSLASNMGFPVACNKGLQVATGDTLLLLNNDVLVARNWLSNMLRCLYSDPMIGIVGPITNYASGKQQIDVPYTNLDDMAERFKHSGPQQWLPTNRIIGLCFLFKRELMDKIGILDERYSPGHYEDDDYCFRARRAGYMLRIAGDSFIFHHGSASFSKQKEEQVRELIVVNRHKFIDKWGVDPADFI